MTPEIKLAAHPFGWLVYLYLRNISLAADHKCSLTKLKLCDCRQYGVNRAPETYKNEITTVAARLVAKEQYRGLLFSLDVDL